jgi:hypothetical protein
MKTDPVCAAGPVPKSWRPYGISLSRCFAWLAPTTFLALFGTVLAKPIVLSYALSGCDFDGTLLQTPIMR